MPHLPQLMRQALRSGNAARVHCLLAGGAGLPALSRPLPPSLAPLILEACCGGAPCSPLRGSSGVSTPFVNGSALASALCARQKRWTRPVLLCTTVAAQQETSAVCRCRAWLAKLVDGHAPATARLCAGDIDCVQMLLEREPSLASAVDPSGTTPVHAAAARGDVGIVQVHIRMPECGIGRLRFGRGWAPRLCTPSLLLPPRCRCRCRCMPGM